MSYKHPASIKFQILNEKARLPERARQGDAGFDLFAMDTQQISAQYWTLCSLGFSIEIPENHVGLVCPRSGFALKTGISVLNAPGIIDSGYRGELGVILINHSRVSKLVEAGDRIAQLLIMPVSFAPAVEVESLSTSERGAAGFGSTGA